MNILICIAGMPQATPTLRMGALFANLEPSEVTLLTVVQRNSELEAAAATLEQARQLLPGVTVTTELKRGKAVKEIVSRTRQGRYDLLVMGERGGGLTDLFLSSVVRRVVRQACTSTLIVKRERPALKRILLCVGGWRVAQAVVSTGAHLAQASGASVTLLHVTSPLPTMYTGLESMEELLSELLQTDSRVARNLRRGIAILDQHDLRAEIKLRSGVAAQEILAEAEQGDYDLIVIHNGLRASRIWRLWADSVAQEVIDNARRPVLAVCDVSPMQPAQTDAAGT